MRPIISAYFPGLFVRFKWDNAFSQHSVLFKILSKCYLLLLSGGKASSVVLFFPNADIFFGFSFAAINGFVFGNVPELSMCAQKRVVWHLFGMGNEVDVHTAFFHGQVLTIRSHRTDVAHIFPATFVTAEMVPQEPGTWLISCQVNSHLQGEIQHLRPLRYRREVAIIVIRNLGF